MTPDSLYCYTIAAQTVTTSMVLESLHGVHHSRGRFPTLVPCPAASVNRSGGFDWDTGLLFRSLS